ncbi:MAG: extensin family protein [Proteobacteria bacterium]|nr:extensin family protein [Pseudomonadota bacterium]
MAGRSRLWRSVFGRLLLAAVIFIAGSYLASRQGLFEWPRQYDPLALPDLTETPHWLTSYQLKLVDFDQQNCLTALRRAGVNAPLQPAQGLGSQCERAGTVKIGGLSASRLRTEETRCAIAARLYMWERHVVQPAARRAFGEPVAEIIHFGSYSCRTIRGRGSMSEHATANAFDVAGFRLKSGKLISLKRDWSTLREGRFLRAVRDGACDWFNLVLSPDYNADHADHFHLDMGWYRSCR